ncbi:NADH-quinone oxidoreductase subunit [Sphingobium amiense]|uniref:NADH-quinone oxidoreductase subunit n=1 Tax=Sphingobium amiense TaxID=135719 RepID=A0A494VVV2_9SPHN|nr:NAD(P)H-dependent oxidoreductase subunit E [Sphingobium amiense]BBD96534.1 NADH-quinone oxidoreductase subunit [Sphingobium amiense]
MEDFISDWVARHGADRDRLLPLLHAIQEEAGHIDPSLVPVLAEALNLSRADIHGVITFYHDFRHEPPARHVVKLCRAESCQARGGAAVEEAATRLLGVPMGEKRGDGRVSIEPVYCLGLCAIGPNALIDGRPVARIDTRMIEQLAVEVNA